MKRCVAAVAALFLSLSNAAVLTVKPGESIQKAIDAAHPGDTVQLEDGEYREDVHTVRDGEIDKRITITGGREAVLYGTGEESRVFQVMHEYITLNGFTIDGKFGPPEGDKEEHYADKLVYITSPRETRVIDRHGTQFRSSLDGVVVSNMKLINAGGECMRARYFVTQLEVFGCHIENCGVYDFVFGGMKAVNGESIYIGTSQNQWGDGKNPTDEPDECRFIHLHHNVLLSKANELDVKEGSVYVLVEHNTCTTQKDTNSGCLDSRSDKVIFRYNDVHGNDGAGLRIGGHTFQGHTYGQEIDVYGNTFYDNGEGALKIQTGAGTHNICENKCKGDCKVGGSASDDYRDIEGKCSGVMDVFWVDETQAVPDAAQQAGKSPSLPTGEPDDAAAKGQPEPQFEATVQTDNREGDSPSKKCFPVEIETIHASSEQGKNTVHAAIDGKSLTRWSAEGKEEWLEIDLTAPTKIDALEIAFFKGDERTQAFEVSVDGNTVLKKQTSSGKTLAMQRFPFPTETEASVVTILGGGNSENDWNSLTEVIVCGVEPQDPQKSKKSKNSQGLCDKVEKLRIKNVQASADDGKNKPGNVVDGDLKTRWSADGSEEQDITVTLDKRPATVAEIGLAVYDGDKTKAFFDVLVETEAHGWEEVVRDGESVRGKGIESYDLGIKGVNSVRVVCYGMEDWESGEQRDVNSFTEIELYGC